MEPMFDKDSFQDEIQTPGDAGQCVEYLAKNEFGFRRELADEGLTYEQIEQEVETVWTNLLKSCKRVGFKSHVTTIKADQLGIKV